MHKFIKFSFHATIQALKAYQFCLVLVALLTMVDFILSMMKIKLPEQIQMCFDTIYNFQSLIYKPDLSISPVDFTLAVFAIEMLIMAGLIVYVIYFVIEFEQIYDKVHSDGCKRYERTFNQKLEKNAKVLESKSKEFVMLFDIKIQRIGESYLLETEKPVDIETKIVEYRLMFRNCILQNFKATCKQTMNGYLIFVQNIEDCEQIFEKMYELAKKSKEMLKEMRLTFELKTAVCIATPTDTQEKYLPKLQKLLNVSVPNKIMALSDFKAKYDNLKTKTYIVNNIGEYSLGAEVLDIYTLEPNRQ